MKYLLALLLLISISFASDCRLVPGPDGNLTMDMNDPNCQQPPPLIDFSPLVSLIMDTVLKTLGDAMNWVTSALFSLLFSTPDINPAKGFYDNVLMVAQSLYSLLIAALGLYWIWGARSVEGRIRAKEWSEKLFALILLEAAGFFIFSLALGLNNNIASAVLQWTNPSGGVPELVATTAVAIIIRIFMLPLLFVTLLTLILRQILIFVMLVLFPFSLMLYMIPMTKQWGLMAVNMTALVIFMGAIDALIIYGAGAIGTISNILIADAILRTIATYCSFALVGVLNVWLLLSAPNMGTQTFNLVRMVMK